MAETRDTIQKIREAEIASQDKEKEAKAQAAKLVEEARAAAKTLVADKLSGLKAGNESASEAADKESAALLADAEQEAQEEIRALREHAAKHEAAAIVAVIGRLIA